MITQKVDVVFYDVTTFYFDSEVEGGLRQKGFGKDGKIGKTQVVFGMMVDKDKNPVGYHLYNGKQYEGHTFVDAINKLKESYQIENVIMVADRGMLNRTNITEVSKHYEFIVGERLKSLPASIQNQIIDIGNYQNTWSYNKDEEQINIKYYVSRYNGRKIISTFSSKRARKDAKEREQKIIKAKELLKNPTSLKKKAFQYYLKEEGDEKNSYIFDEEKINRSAKFDGFISIATNNEDLPIEMVLDHYRHLFQIEQTFRTFKSHLEIRPMFHWTDERIKGHIAMCYIAYAIERYFLNRMACTDKKISENEFRRTLSKMQVSHLKQDEKEYLLRSNIDANTKSIINAIGLKERNNLTPL